MLAWVILLVIWSFTVYYFVYLGILDIVDDHAETYRVYEYAPRMDLDSSSPMKQLAFSFGHLQRWSSSFYPSGPVLLH